jgi:hypothetical protein
MAWRQQGLLACDLTEDISTLLRQAPPVCVGSWHNSLRWSDDRVAEGAPLLREYGV